MKAVLFILGIVVAAILLFSGQPEQTSDTTTTASPDTSQAADTEPDTDTTEPDQFMGYDCLDDCSGHEAGYEWAGDNDVCDAEYDGGNSESFAEGVRAYAEENCY